MYPPSLPLLRRLAVASVFLLAACETPVRAPEYPEITFKHLDPIRLDVADVEFVDKYAAPNAAPNVEHLFPVRPAAVAQRWPDERIEPVGVARKARVTLINAAVTEADLEIEEGLLDLFYVDQSKRYDGEAEMLVEVVGEGGRVLAYARASAKQSRTAPEDLSINDREQLWFDLTESMMRDLNRELEIAIRRYLAEYVR